MQQRAPTTPRVLVEHLRSMIEQSGRSKEELAELANIDPSSLYRICSVSDSGYLPNIGTVVAVVLAVARLKKTWWNQGAWAQTTLLEIEELMQLHAKAKSLSRRQNTGHHRAISPVPPVLHPQIPETNPPLPSSHQGLPEWIWPNSNTN